MHKLYRFFFLLFLCLSAVCFLFSVLNTWAVSQLFKATTTAEKPLDFYIPLNTYLKLGVLRGVTLGLFVFTIIILLFKKSHHLGLKFSIRKILQALMAFLIITLIISLLFTLWLSNKGWHFSFIKFYLDSPVSLQTPYWLIFPVGWTFLYLFLAARIKPVNNGGSKN